jgi:hypothetical protein
MQSYEDNSESAVTVPIFWIDLGIFTENPNQGGFIMHISKSWKDEGSRPDKVNGFVQFS